MVRFFRTSILNLRRLAAEPLLLIVVAAIFASLFIFIVLPMWRVLVACFVADGHISFGALASVLTKSYNIVPFLHSITLGFWVALLGTAVGYIFAFSLTRIRMPAAPFFRIVATFPIISPPFVVSMSAILLLGRNGTLTHLIDKYLGINLYALGFDIFGLGGLILVETLAYFPTAFLLLIGVLNAIDPALEEAALDLGASRWRVFRTVTFPLSLPGIAASFLLIFIESLADFGNPMILSGRYNVLPTQAYLLITGALHDFAGGSLLAIMLLVPSLIAFFIQKYYLERRSFVTVTGKPAAGRIKEMPGYTRATLFFTCCLFVGVIFIFYGMIIYGSFTRQWGADSTLTFSNYRELFERGSEYLTYIKASLLLSAVATPLTGIFGMIVAYLVVRRQFPGRGALELISMLTFALPGTIVGIGYILAFNQPPLMLQGTAAIIVLMLLFRNAPVGIQAGVASLRQIDRSIEEASLDLGASSIATFFRITLPLIASAFFAGLAYSFVKSMTAVSAVIFVASGKWTLITIAILDAVEGSDYSQAAALSIVLILFVLAALGVLQLLVGRLGRGGLVRTGATA
ncbi:MAG: iron ABC transporter permease [bacterium]